MILDIVVALILFYAFYSGYSKGIIGAVFSIASLLIGILAAMKLSTFVIDALDKALNINPAITFVLGFALTFIIVIALIRLLGKKLEDLLKFANLNFINKILGGVALTAMMAVILAYGYKGLNNLQLVSEEQMESSITYPMLEPLPDATKPITTIFVPIVQNFWDRVAETMDDIKEKGEKRKNRNVIDG